MVHLGMSGSLTHRRNGFDASLFDPRHDHVRLRLDDGSVLVYNDPRRFGLIKVAARAQIDMSEELKALGPEPLNSGFDARYLKEKARRRKVAIKNFLMDQRIVAGIGNIYASEILFHAGVRPTRRAGGLKREEIERIIAATPAVLREAIGNKGTTFRSYRDSRGRPGRFASRLCVYGREGERCYVCGASIRKVKVGQRSSFFCPGCQH
jgi:formamidopyrimidine-DNA glycosylase